MRSVSDFTRSRTSSCVSVLGVTLQPATTATTANITRLRGRKPVARRETEGVLFIFMFSKNWCSAFDRCGSCDGARAVQSVLGHALHLGAEALGRAGQLNRLFLHRRFVTSLHGLRRSFAFATDATVPSGLDAPCANESSRLPYPAVAELWASTMAFRKRDSICDARTAC